MRRTLEQYREIVVAVRDSAFSPQEKVRHYQELLAHMRAQYGASLQENDEAHSVYLMIRSMFRSY